MNKFIRYQNWVILAVLLASITQSTAANGQTTNDKSTSTSYKVGLGRLWVNVAKWQWQLKKKNEPIPSFDSSSVEKFRLAVAKGNPAGLHSLYNAVLVKLPNESYYGVSNEEFIQALELVLHKKTEFSSDQVNNIVFKLKELDAGKPAELVSASHKAINQSVLSRSKTDINTPTIAVDSEAHESREQNVSILEALKRANADNEELRFHRNVLAIVAALTVLTLIGNVVWSYRRASKVTSKQSMSTATHTGLSSTHKGSSDFTKVKFEKDLTDERRRYNQLLEEYNGLKTRYERTDTNTDLESQKSIPSTTSMTTNLPPVVPAQPSTPPLFVQFADKPENRYLTRLYPDSEAYRPLLIRFSSDPSVSEAHFEFNPAADQFFFTHNGVDQLTGTFTYSPPDWVKNPQTIRTIASGRLRRDETGWLIDKPAQIEIC
jgi:hypothetical protein